MRDGGNQEKKKFCIIIHCANTSPLTCDFTSLFSIAVCNYCRIPKAFSYATRAEFFKHSCLQLESNFEQYIFISYFVPLPGLFFLQLLQIIYSDCDTMNVVEQSEISLFILSRFWKIFSSENVFIVLTLVNTYSNYRSVPRYFLGE